MASPESFSAVSGHEGEQPRGEVSSGVDGVTAVEAEGDADVEHHEADL